MPTRRPPSPLIGTKTFDSPHRWLRVRRCVPVRRFAFLDYNPAPPAPSANFASYSANARSYAWRQLSSRPLGADFLP